MCKTISKYKCGTCQSCYSSKRNSLMIRVQEHYNGIIRNFQPNEYAMLFGMLTYTDANLPTDHWQRSVQLYLKRLNKLFPFLRFEYLIVGELSKKSRFHCHPIFFVTPRETLPKLTKSGTLRFTEMLNAIEDDKTYSIKLLHSDSKQRKETANFTSFEKYVRHLLIANWTLGLSELRPLTSAKGALYITKYVTKSRNEFFRQRSYLNEDTKVKTTKYILKYDPWAIEKVIGYTALPQSIPIAVQPKKKIYYKDIYKCYLISRGLGDYFYETSQYLDLLKNFKIQKHTIQSYDFQLTLDVLPSLKWFNPNQKDCRGYSLPLKYRKHLLDNIAPIYSPYRMYIGQCGQNSLAVHYFETLVSMCHNYNIAYTLETDYSTYNGIPRVSLSSDGWNKLNSIQSKNYYEISCIKDIINNLCDYDSMD